MAIPIYTTQAFNQSMLQPAGAVFAQRVEGITGFRNMLAEFAGIMGGRNEPLEKKMNDLTAVVLSELQLQAKTQYPNAVAIVDVKITFNDVGRNDQQVYLAGQGSGTVLVKRVAGPGPGPGPMAMATPMAMAAPMPAISGGRRNKSRKSRKHRQSRKHR